MIFRYAGQSAASLRSFVKIKEAGALLKEFPLRSPRLPDSAEPPAKTVARNLLLNTVGFDVPVIIAVFFCTVCGIASGHEELLQIAAGVFHGVVTGDCCLGGAAVCFTAVFGERCKS